MRQSTLLFGRGAGGMNGHSEEGESTSGDAGDAFPPAKKPRRAAASKSEEKSKRQMQMQMQATLATNGKLQKSTPENTDRKESIIIDDDSSSDVETVKAEVVKKANAEVKAPISLSVKGTLDGSTTAHSFFAKRSAVKAPNVETMSSLPSDSLSAVAKQKWPQQREAPWPDSNNVHVHPNEELILVDHDVQLPRRSSTVYKRIAEEPYSWSTQSTSASTSSIPRPVKQVKESRKTVIPSFIANSVDIEGCKRGGKLPKALEWMTREAQINHPASEGLWADRWRPTRADHVLGNEKRSLLLRNWLKELEVTGEVKGGRVIKKVERRKRRPKEDLDGFVVDDEEEIWFDQFRKPSMEASSEADLDESGTLDYLMNAMVLHGPTGSGKTAAVYACAAELGFEVFEIYPGSGRRSGKDIGHAVGNLGRNHMVSSGGMGGGATWKGSKLASALGGNSNEPASGPRQSLILLEEVDLLYEEDKGFWAAVVELISISKRPVVMTCNDISCIPHTTFPIQAILAFEAPQEVEAIAYLQLMAACQGHILDRGPIQSLYRSTTGIAKEQWKTSHFTIPSSGAILLESSLASLDKAQTTESSPDLRQAIMQLQYLCQRGAKCGSEASDTFQTGSLDVVAQRKAENEYTRSSFREEIRRTEIRSFCDALLEQPFDRASELLEPDEYKIDDVNNVQVQGPIILPKAKVKMEVITLASLGREEEYIEALLGSDDESSVKQCRYDQLRWKESERADKLMKTLCPSDSSLALNSFVVEIAPLVGNMVLVDDDEQATYHARLSNTMREIQRNLSENGKEGLNSANQSLMQMGIRPSRHITRVLLERGGDGTLALGRRELTPCRWIQVDDNILQSIRENRLTM